MEYDVIVVGGGPAGSLCARSLGQQNAKVLLLDKATFPRDKTCGDFISARLCQNLQQMGILEEILKAPHAQIDDLLFSHPFSGSFLLKDSLKRECSNALVCKRETLDAIFWNEAKKYVDVIEGVKVKKILFNKEKAIGVETENATYMAKIIVGADGANGITAKAFNTHLIDENHHAVAIRSYYSGVKNLTSSVELHFIDEVQPGYFWIFPTNLETNEANVGLGILSRNVRYNQVQLKQLQQRIIEEHPLFKDRFEGSSCIAPLAGWSLPFGSKYRPKAFEGALLVGDAAGLIDPMSGEGIENAVRSSECAVQVIQKALLASNFSQQFLMEYERKIDALFGDELKKGYYIQKISRNKTALKLIFGLLKYSKYCRGIVADKFF